MPCHGNATDHCCYVAGVECDYLERNTVPGRKWACALRRELGSWYKVHADARYLRDVRARLPAHIPDCGDWPPSGMVCASCGEVG